MKPTEQHAIVQAAYAEAASRQMSCCGDTSTASQSISLGYSADQLDSIPAEADLGLGCGNPTALASLKPGERVLDLGSGAGIDALLAAKAVTSSGRVIGVDMTPGMLNRSRRLAVDQDCAEFVEFREGMIEDLPVVSDSVDVVISNCVINLSPDKPRVFQEAFRVLKSGGRLCVSDICLSEPLPSELAESAAVVAACIGAAALADDYLSYITAAGFNIIEVDRVAAGALLNLDVAGVDPLIGDAIRQFGPDRVQRAAESIWSYRIEAKKDC